MPDPTPYVGPATCIPCGGVGEIEINRPDDVFVVECSNCDGAGTLDECGCDGPRLRQATLNGEAAVECIGCGLLHWGATNRLAHEEEIARGAVTDDELAFRSDPARR